MPETCSERVGIVYTCLCLNALLFVVLICTDLTAGIIYLFCFVSVAGTCACFAAARYVLETYFPPRANVCSEA
jgi:hypothetical protein